MYLLPGVPSKGVSGVAVPGSDNKKKENEEDSRPSKNMLVMSGGEGYVDFRMGE